MECKAGDVIFAGVRDGAASAGFIRAVLHTLQSGASHHPECAAACSAACAAARAGPHGAGARSSGAEIHRLQCCLCYFVRPHRDLSAIRTSNIASLTLHCLCIPRPWYNVLTVSENGIYDALPSGGQKRTLTALWLFMPCQALEPPSSAHSFERKTITIDSTRESDTLAVGANVVHLLENILVLWGAPEPIPRTAGAVLLLRPSTTGFCVVPGCQK